MEIKNKEELINYLESYVITYDYEKDYTNIRNSCIDYMNNTQDFDIEECFDSIVSYDVAEDIAKYELENGGLVRLYYFLGDANCNNSVFRINGYGNLEDITKDDLEYLKEDILDRLKDSD